MYERALKGIRYQILGLNLWIIATVFLMGAIALSGDFITFLLGVLMIILSAVGLIMFITGLVFLLIGSKEVSNITMTFISLLAIILAPFIMMGGFLSLPPVNYILIMFGLWTLFGSVILPYIKLGGWLTGTISLIFQTIFVSYFLIAVLYGSEMNVDMVLSTSLLGGYFVFLEISMVIGYVRVRGMRKRLEVVEAPPSGAIELDLVPVQRKETASLNPDRKKEFKVLGVEEGRSSAAKGDEKELFADVPAFERLRREIPKKEPVVGRAVDFDRLLHWKPKEERYTVEEEQEIEITWEDLFIDGQDLYQVLKVERNVSSREIRKAYRKRALLFHPDKNRDMGPLYADTIGREMIKLNKAKEILLDPARRSLYDEMLSRYR
ncbi:MAG: DnaJ domain-containing protein [Thermoplasmatota archaeon]